MKFQLTKHNKWILKSTLSLAGGLILLGTTQSMTVNAEDTTVENQETVTADDTDQSGTWGSVNWTISNGVLNLEAGTLDNISSDSVLWTDAQKDSVTSINIDGKVIAGASVVGLFSGFKNVTSITGLDNLDTSKTSNYASMFSGDTKLTSLVIPTSFDTTNIAEDYLNFNSMFLNCSALESLDLSNLKMGETSNARKMLQGTSKLSKLTLSSANDIEDSELSINNVTTDNSKVTGWASTSDPDTVISNKTLLNMYTGENDGSAKTTWQWHYEDYLSFDVQYVGADGTILYTDKVTDVVPGDIYTIRSLSYFNVNAPGYDMTSPATKDSETSFLIKKEMAGEPQQVLVAQHEPLKIQIIETDTDGKSVGGTSIELPVKDLSINDTTWAEKLSAVSATKKLIPSSSDDEQDNSYIEMDGQKISITQELLVTIGDDLESFISNLINSNYMIDDPEVGGNILSLDASGQSWVIHAVYEPEADTDTGSGGSSSNNNSNNNSSSEDKTTSKIDQTSATFTDREAVQLYDDNGKMITDHKLAPNTAWLNDTVMNLNGDEYYRVATNQWVKAIDVYVYTAKVAKLHVNLGSFVRLVKADGKQVTNRGLAAESNWKTDRYIYLQGEKYYRVATNEFVSADSVTEYE